MSPDLTPPLAAAVGLSNISRAIGCSISRPPRAAMYNADKRPPLLSFICGLGGREVTLEDVAKAADMCYAAAKAGKSDPKTHWLGVRE